jgi:hypothetical protein
MVRPSATIAGRPSNGQARARCTALYVLKMGNKCHMKLQKAKRKSIEDSHSP